MVEDVVAVSDTTETNALWISMVDPPEVTAMLSNQKLSADTVVEASAVKKLLETERVEETPLMLPPAFSVAASSLTLDVIDIRVDEVTDAGDCSSSEKPVTSELAPETARKDPLDPQVTPANVIANEEIVVDASLLTMKLLHAVVELPPLRSAPLAVSAMPLTEPPSVMAYGLDPDEDLSVLEPRSTVNAMVP